MKRDFLGDAGCFQPVLQGCLRQFVCETLKNLARSVAANQFQCLVTDGVVHQFLRLLHPKGDVHTTVAVWLYVCPFKLLDVALPQSCQTGEKKSGFQYGIFAGRIGKGN